MWGGTDMREARPSPWGAPEDKYLGLPDRKGVVTNAMR